MNFSFTKKGFTFSEVLLTLVIIGVVAALTIPFIYANYTTEIRNAKVKKFHKLMNDALDSYYDDNYREKPFGGGMGEVTDRT